MLRSMISTIFSALLTLGLPVFFATWYLFRRLYRTGALELGVDPKTLKDKFKEMKKQKTKSNDFLHKNWMKFGGGFYGSTAVTTLILIELMDLVRFVLNFPGLAVLFEDGVFSLLVDILVNQFQNFIMAAIWFVHWSDDGIGMLIWGGAAYLGYWLGLRAAAKSLEEWQTLVDARLEKTHSSAE